MKCIFFIKELFLEGHIMDFLGCVFLLVILQASFPASFAEEWSSWQPASLQALKDSCVVIPCSFTYPGPRRTSREFSASWYRYKWIGYPEVYNSKSPVQGDFHGRTRLSEDLGSSRCSLLINNIRDSDVGDYYTWIDPDTNSFVFYHTLTAITVTDTPKSPTLSYPAIMSEGESVTINCSVEHTCPPSPPSLSWNWSGIKARVHQKEFSRDSWKTVSSFTYYPSSEDHERSLQCSVTYPNGQQSQRHITLHVKYPPKNTIISIVQSGKLVEGDFVNMMCSTHSNPATTTYSWFQGLQKVLIPDETEANISVGNLRRDSGPYYCRAQNELGTGESLPLVVPVQYKPVILPELKCTLWGEAVICNCTAEGDPLPLVEWHFPSLNAEGGDGFNATLFTSRSMVTSVLSGKVQQPLDLSCSASNSQGVTIQHVTHFTKGDTTPTGNHLLIISGALGCAFLVLFVLSFVFCKIFRKTKKPARENHRIPKAEGMKMKHFRDCKSKKKDRSNKYTNRIDQTAYYDETEEINYENIEALKNISEQLYCNM